MKIFFSLILLIIYNFIYSQQIDKIIKNDVYTSYFSTEIKQPLIVEYKLYKGGGECNRKSFRFKAEKYTAQNIDYAKSGYDKGHLCNAEDFAYDCNKDEQTFRYYNCLPQTVSLNRGIWKKYETIVRNISQKDSLLVICGGFAWNKIIGKNKIAVPDSCYKIVQSLTTKKIIYCLVFANDNSKFFRTSNPKQLAIITKLKFNLKQ